jgi:hypothetical protein
MRDTRVSVQPATTCFKGFFVARGVNQDIPCDAPALLQDKLVMQIFLYLVYSFSGFEIHLRAMFEHVIVGDKQGSGRHVLPHCLHASTCRQGPP